MKRTLLLLLIATTIFVGCSKKSDPTPEIQYVISKTSLITKFDEEYKFVVTQGTETIDPLKVKFTSSNSKVGVIGQDGLFSAKRIGETKITAVVGQTTLVAEIIVIPYSTLCKEPFLGFGSTINEVKSKETRSLSAQTATAMLYIGENLKVRNIMYMFEAGKLDASVLLLSNSNLVIEESVKFFSERYEYLGKSSNDVYIFENESAAVGLSYDASLGFNAIYIKNNNAKTSSIKSIEKAYNENIKAISSVHKEIID